MLHLQAAVTAMKVQQGFASYRSLYLLLFFQRGASAIADFLQKIAKDNVRPMLKEADDFLAKHRNFSGSEKLGEGDVRGSEGALTAVHDVLPAEQH